MASIALVIADLGAGGAQSVVVALAARWAKRGHRVVVVSLARPETDFFALDQRIERRVVGGLGASGTAWAAVWSNLRRIRVLRRTLVALDCDVIVSFIASTNILTVLATRGLGKRIVISERNDPRLQRLGRAWEILRRWTYARADLVTANSAGAINHMVAYVPRERLAQVPNLMRADFTPRPATTRSPVFLNVARLQSQKGQDVLLDAFASIAGKHPEWTLVILGEGKLRANLEARAERLGITPRVRFLGTVADVGDYYASASVFVLPSLHEGTPNALIEAMSAGLPAVVTDASSGMTELVRNEENGLVVASGDSAVLAAAMSRLAADENLRSHLGDAARQIRTAYDPERVLDIWTRLILDHRQYSEDQ